MGDRPPVAQAGGDRGIVLKFFETAIYFLNFNFFKYKNEKNPAAGEVGGYLLRHAQTVGKFGSLE